MRASGTRSLSGEDVGKEVARRHTGPGFSSFARACAIRFSRSDLMPDSESLQVADLVPEILESPGSAARPPRAVSNDPEQERFSFFDSAARLLKRLSSLQPLVIFIDDLQAADEPSMQMLTF